MFGSRLSSPNRAFRSSPWGLNTNPKATYKPESISDEIQRWIHLKEGLKYSERVFGPVDRRSRAKLLRRERNLASTGRKLDIGNMQQPQSNTERVVLWRLFSSRV